MAKRGQRKKTSSLISKKNRSINGNVKNNEDSLLTNTKSIPKTLKPLRARQLIRRFHVLLKYKSLILKKLKELGKLKNLDTDDDYLEFIKSHRKYLDIYKDNYNKTWSELKINKTPDSVIDPESNTDKIDGSIKVEGLVAKMGKIDAEIQKRGGLETYQTASTLGQDGKRGGDSSKLLVKWLREISWAGDNALEIGCLSSKNEISKCKIFKEIDRLDLHSQEPGVIEEQDFLERPIPESECEKYDCISCSLVVNFVPNAELRGNMIQRICDFLKNPVKPKYSLLFFVLPLPCVENSRYVDLSTMNSIFENLGFEEIKYHASNKLAYWLLKWNGDSKINKNYVLKKKEIRKGNNRNNFCISIR